MPRPVLRDRRALMRASVRCVAAMESPSQSSCRHGRILLRISLKLQNGREKTTLNQFLSTEGVSSGVRDVRHAGAERSFPR